LDPVTAFATIVGLLGTFKSERRTRSDDEYRAFIDWLGEKRHTELVRSIQGNVQLVAALAAFLHGSHDEVMSKLANLDETILMLASRIDGVQDVARAIAPGSGVSDQALSILQQLSESGGSVFLELKTFGGTTYQVMDAQAQIEVKEPRFVEDDLSQLCSLGLLLQDSNSNGGRLFRITRASVRFVQNVVSHS